MKTLMIEVRDVNNVECLKRFGNITFVWEELNYIEMEADPSDIEKIVKCENVITCNVSKKGTYQPCFS